MKGNILFLFQILSTSQESSHVPDGYAQQIYSDLTKYTLYWRY